MTPRVLNGAGKFETVAAPRITLASPRYRVRVPMVTAREGSPTRVMSRPLISPASAPMTMQTMKIRANGQWWVHSAPIVSADTARTDATDRSISPVMMISVIGTAMIARSPMFVHRVKML